MNYNPFATFTVDFPYAAEAEPLVETPSDRQLDSSSDLDTDSSSEPGMDFPVELAVSLASQIPHTMEAFPDTTPAERSLFHHYISHVAVIMMPYEHARNPWKLYYPAVAHGRAFPDQTALYHAMLSQAAFNISHLRSGDLIMTAAGTQHYAAAIRHLVPVIGDKVNDFGSLLASIMTLIFAETYSGEPRKWRHHLQGAWRLFNQYRDCEPWKVTDFVCVSIQSLNIIRIISETSEVAESQTNEATQDTVQSNEASGTLGLIKSTFDFGFTVGASPAILECIASITKFRKAGKSFGDGESESFLERILGRLKVCLEDTIRLEQQILPQGEHYGEDEEASEFYSSHAQHISFVYATYIYLYRAILLVPPQIVANYVSKIFHYESMFPRL